MERIFSSLGVAEDTEIAHPLLSKTIESAQRRVEGTNFAIRKNVLEYDDVMNMQRNLIYKQRREVLEGQDLHPYYKRIIAETMDATLADFLATSESTSDWDKEALVTRVIDMFGPLPALAKFASSKEDTDGYRLASDLKDDALARLEEREIELGSPEMLREAERVILLQTVDNHWMDHIDMMDDLRDSIGMRGYAQHDPVVEYKREGYDMFEVMSDEIQHDAVRLIMRARFTAEDPKPRRRVPAKVFEGRGSSGWSRASAESMASAGSDMSEFSGGGNAPPAAEPVKKKQLPGRNEPCWCGSGKKYKNCHLRQDEEESM